MHRLEYYDYDKEDAKTRGWRSIHVSDNGGEHPYMDKWWVPGLNIGYEHSFINQFADFVDGFGSCFGTFWVPTHCNSDIILTKAKVGRVRISMPCRLRTL